MLVGKVTGIVDVDGLPTQFFEQELTKEYLDMGKDAFKQLIGDGEGKVSVSMNMSDSNFGTGFGAHVTTTLVCDQSAEGLEDGFMLAKGLTTQFLEDAYGEAEELFKKTPKMKKGR